MHPCCGHPGQSSHPLCRLCFLSGSPLELAAPISLMSFSLHKASWPVASVSFLRIKQCSDIMFPQVSVKSRWTKRAIPCADGSMHGPCLSAGVEAGTQPTLKAITVSKCSDHNLKSSREDMVGRHVTVHLHCKILNSKLNMTRK